ncbi:MAG: DUF1549 and DUF1553 domain-containing protein [Bryobacteraceae bacterium]|nr:DUF1549 and DUF1553 domain-containing protein [Bryobacteraceae bacterium]
MNRVTRRLALAMCLLPVLSAQELPVKVELFESVPTGSEFQPDASFRTEIYSEPAFAFVRTPTRFSANAIAQDRSTPFILKASYRRAFAAGQYRFRLRSRGAAAFFVDGREVARNKAQKPNTTGDDPVPPEVVRDGTPLRPAAYPHQDALINVTLDGAEHDFAVIAVIGGKGLYPSPGELAVSYSSEGGLDRLLGPADAPLLTDAAWEDYVAASDRRHGAADVARRRQVSEETVAEWKRRHEKVRAYLKTRAAPARSSIDAFIGDRLAEAKVSPTGPIPDVEFLRRLTLDVTGVIPTPAAIREFLADAPQQRRAKAIDRLLDSPGWADHWVSYWQDVLAENPGILKPDLNNTGPFRYWIHQSFSDNIPFDRFAAELIQMEGSVYLGAPAAFSQATLNDAPMAAKADIVAQAFLGQRMQCARCHDAPFHPFKQKDLFSLSAMLDGKPVKLPATSTVPVKEGGRKPMVTIALKAGEEIAPAWPFDSLAAHADSAELPGSGALPTRRQVAAFIISPDNERFTKVVVNRVWKRYLGVGIFEPVDDWARGKASHPELLDYLSREFMMSGYDMKHLARLILSSDLYQRRPVGDASEMNSPDRRLFAGPARRSMTAEQLVDSLHLAAGKPFECEEMNLNPAGDRAPKQFLNMGRPSRSWQMTALSNERDRPALALPIAQSIVDVMTTYGWRQSRQNPATVRDDAPSPMQTLILANGVLGTRIARLSDDSAFTELAMSDLPLEKLIEESFLRVLSRLPKPEESRTFVELLKPHYAGRRVQGAEAVRNERKTDSRVSWSNHLSAEATLIRMEEERRLRMGDQPTKRLTPEFRERFEDTLWALINSPEFVVLP